MREIVLQVPRRDVEDVLDRLLPWLPGGVREVEGPDAVELLIRGPDLPPLSQIVALTGRPDLPARERQVPDDWRERRHSDYVPDLIAGQLVVRPVWAPRADSPIEIVLEEGPAFGAGRHPTTRTCLELLLGLAPAGSFADLGCGSGILALLAVQLGWTPVVAVDVSPAAVEVARGNAQANRVNLEARLMDLAVERPPAVSGFAANLPTDIHERLAGQLPDPLPQVGLLSGFHTAETSRVLAFYEARGLELVDRREAHGWSVVLMQAPLSGPGR